MTECLPADCVSVQYNLNCSISRVSASVCASIHNTVSCDVSRKKDRKNENTNPLLIGKFLCVLSEKKWERERTIAFRI